MQGSGRARLCKRDVCAPRNDCLNPRSTTARSHDESLRALRTRSREGGGRITAGAKKKTTRARTRHDITRTLLRIYIYTHGTLHIKIVDRLLAVGIQTSRANSSIRSRWRWWRLDPHPLKTRFFQIALIPCRGILIEKVHWNCSDLGQMAKREGLTTPSGSPDDLNRVRGGSESHQHPHGI